ncbi:MAG: FAD-dependent monooxygenase [Candidatus Sulfotelmatobacter sp.]|jgi:flavin-dependent dehydrogenase
MGQSAPDAIPDTTDVFVIGGGPAGLAAAIAARARGFRVLVADGAQPPVDKACGEGLLPDGRAALEQLGIHVPLADAHPFRGIRFVSTALSADARFPGDSCGIAVRRTSLHRLLVERAAQLGAGLLWSTAVAGISSEGVHLRNRVGSRVDERMVRARWIVGADGSNSRVRRWAGLDHLNNHGRQPRLRYAFRRHYRVAPWSDHMEVYWGDRCQGYATAVSSEQVCVALASHDSSLRVEEGLRALPRLQERLAGAQAVSAERGALTGNRTLTRVWRGNVALIGDASGTVDAITGEGLGLAFSQAVVLARCFESGDLRRYQTEHRRLARRPLWMARLMLTLDQRPWLQHRTLQVFQTRPEVFRRFLEMHVGALPPIHALRDGLSLGWGLLTV